MVTINSTEITQEQFVQLFIYCGVLYMQEPKLERLCLGEPVGWVDASVSL
jgi:hypothetical protein